MVHVLTCALNRFPKLFPPLRPEVVAQRTVDAVRTNTAFVYLPWTMNALVILKRYWELGGDQTVQFGVFVFVIWSSQYMCSISVGMKEESFRSGMW